MTSDKTNRKAEAFERAPKKRSKASENSSTYSEIPEVPSVLRHHQGIEVPYQTSRRTRRDQLSSSEEESGNN